MDEAWRWHLVGGNFSGLHLTYIDLAQPKGKLALRAPVGGEDAAAPEEGMTVGQCSAGALKSLARWPAASWLVSVATNSASVRI